MFPPLLPLLLLLPFTLASKRGLVQVSSTQSTDDTTLLSSPSSLSWYYNYKTSPTTSIGIEFVPMLWGPPEGSYNFTAEVKSLLSNTKLSITSILGFNEPDMSSSVGGSSITPSHAAELWKTHIQPIASLGVKLGAPGISGSESGKQWLAEFFTACGNCTVDFIPIHWYGTFEGFASFIGEIRATYLDKDLWITEFGIPNASLEETQKFFNSSVEYLDRLDYVKRYSWFGSFRSDVSNVGPNVAMLDNKGELTDIGAWYIGRKATGHKPQSAAGRVVMGWKDLGMALGMVGVVVAFM
ncbi:glycosyl hydrolase catalytic core-domain-containing protein [Trichophaea hybrida]|nr:glycosyl hydrolase catalytic core-domain-containing protein [Trichophaea hybrida]